LVAKRRLNSRRFILKISSGYCLEIRKNAKEKHVSAL